LITRFDTSKYPVRFGGECKASTSPICRSARATPRKSHARRLDRFGQFGIAASLSAVSDCRHRFHERKTAPAAASIIGSGIGGIETLEEQNKILWERGVSRVSPFTVPRLMVNAASGNVSIIFHLTAPTPPSPPPVPPAPTPSATPADSSSTTWPM
jgi:3-oxoacyl-[acyl-carrier-protein] synthase II